MVEIEVLVQDGPGYAAFSPPAPGVERPARAALAAAGMADGHVAIVFVEAAEIRRLNREFRGHDRPTDVLSFPVDEAEAARGPRELGDVIICRAHTDNLARAVVHGVLHLCGYDHEVDDGEMLALEGEVMESL